MNPHSIFLLPTDSRQKYESEKSAGIGSINVGTIKTWVDFITEPICYIVNLCIEKAIWFNAFKKADMKPIHEGKDRHKMSNFRPT